MTWLKNGTNAIETHLKSSEITHNFGNVARALNGLRMESTSRT